eukprot:431342-Ditylum_brightwellii.AAC.1
MERVWLSNNVSPEISFNSLYEVRKLLMYNNALPPLAGQKPSSLNRTVSAVSVLITFPSNHST